MISSPHGDDRARVLAATDIVELIGRAVKLQRRGREFIGLCPFHQEKTPSFHVKPEGQYFYCFGCKASGTAFDFVMKRDRVEFKDAMISLAQAANVELSNSGANREALSQRQMLLEIQSGACAFFEKLLAHPQIGKPARDYLAERGFDATAIKNFRIGFAPDAWDGLLRSQELRKFQPQQLALAGVVKTRESGGFYDTFRNRLMFPIRDEGGRVIGFGGRVMPGSQDPAKYLNSPETPLFSKSRVAYGLDLARTKIVESRTVAVVEGYTDVMMAHQFGASNVVSVLGTALTPQHVALLRRFADRIVLLFDADVAGDAAVDRAVELFLTQPVEVAIASMPTGVDPDEFVLAHGSEGFAKLIAEAQDALTYKWKQLIRQFDTNGDSITGQQKAVQAYLDLLAGARGSGPIDSLRWGAALARVSRLTGIPIDDLNARFRTSEQPQRSPFNRPVNHRNASAVLRQTTSSASPTYRAQRWILGTLLAEPKRWHQVQMHVHVDDFDPGTLRELADFYWDYQRNEGEPLFSELLSVLPDDSLKALAMDLMQEVESQEHRDKGLQDSIASLAIHRTEAERHQRQAVMASMSDADEIEQLNRLTELSRAASARNKNF